MTTVTTKAMAKVAAVATGLAMATSMLSLAPMAHAAALTDTQVSAIISLLSSFGADASTIANVQASLTGGTPASTGSTSTASSCSFTKDLTNGSSGAEVTCLQQALIAGGYSIPAGATGYFGAQTVAAVSAWQKAAGVSPAVGYFGSKSRAAFNLGGSSSSTGSTGSTTGTTVTGNGLKVAVSATSPSGSVLVQGQAIGVLGEFVFSNPTSAAINVTGLSFKRTGVSNDSTLSNVYLYNNGTRITDSAGVSSSAFSYSDAAGIFTVPAGSTYNVAVRSDIAGSTSGQQVGVSLVSVSSNGTLDSSVSFPINSGYQTISAASLATVDYTVAATPSSVASISPQNDYPVWQDTISVSTNPVKLASIKFTNLGSIDSALVTNLRLYVDGVMVGSAVPAMNANRTVTFDLSAAPVSLSTQSHIVKVLADITGGASRTIQLSVQRTSDAMFVDGQLNQPVTPTSLGTTFSAVSTAVITINSVSGTSGVSVTRAPASPSANVAVGASSVKWASYTMLATGESVKVSDLYVYAATSVHNGGLNNGKIYVNGTQVGSTKDIGEDTANAVDFSLGSSLILPAGIPVTVDIYADAQTATSTNLSNNETVLVTIKSVSSNAQGQASLNSATVPASDTSGNTITVSSSSLTATKYTGYGNQTMIAGASNAKIGAFTLSTGSTEGVTVNTIAFSLATGNAASITSLTLKDEATGSTIGTVNNSPSDTSNSYSVSLNIPASSSKTIGIYADLKSGIDVGTIQATVTTATAGTGSVTGVSAAAASTALQTITIGNGTLTATRGAGDPVSNNVLAGASSVQVGQFNFAAANSAYTVNNLAILVANNAATSVTSVTVKGKDAAGNVVSQTQPLAVSALLPYATATFTGLGMYVPMNDSANLDVYVGTPTIASGATSGSAINVTLDAGATAGTLSYSNSAGTVATQINSGTNLASNGTFYVRKSIPTLAMLSTGVTVPATGSPIYKFSVKADAAGPVEWTKFVFNIATTSATVTNVYLTDDASGNNLLDNTTTSASTTATTITVDLTKNATAASYQQVAAGETKIYNLYGTVTGFTTGSTVTLSLASDAATTANAAAASVSGNTVWSDRSGVSGSHTTATADWTNGYLLKNFTSNAVTYSK